MKKRIGVFAAALLMFAGMVYGEDTEVGGDFRVNGGTYYYDFISELPGLSNPRCACDTAIDDSPECAEKGFFSDIDYGMFCYDQFTVSGLQFSKAYNRTLATKPAFVITKGGDAYIPIQGNGLILRDTSGMNCHLLTVNSTGGLQTTGIPCP